MKGKSSNNLLFMLNNWLIWSKKDILFVLINIPVTILIPTIISLIPALMIEAIKTSAPLPYFVATIAGISILLSLLSWVQPALSKKAAATEYVVTLNYAILGFKKLLNMDYEQLESFESRQKFERSKNFMFGRGYSPGAYSVRLLLQFCTNLFGIAAYTAILSFVSPWLILVILLTGVTEYVCNQLLQKFYARYYDKLSILEMRFDYFFRLSNNPKASKDIRLYNAKDWLFSILDKNISAHRKLTYGYNRKCVAVSIIRFVSSSIRDVIILIVLIFAVNGGNYSVSEFIFYFGLLLGFSGWINGLTGQISEINKACTECQRFRDFIDIPDRKHDTDNVLTPSIVESIEFRNVSFSYDKEHTIKKINLIVRSGEKIAIVGENGAGKTTLIKLLCGLYSPNEGEIILNGINIEKYQKESYYDLFSVVFQDYNFLPADILTNIAMSKDVNTEKVMEVVEKAGLTDKICSLEQGLSSKFIKQLYEEATEFSGGEEQRLLLARALYKDAPVFILDEPTAALDPIAEERLYKEYAEFSIGKMVFFISHRLASTRFCDRIIYLHNGEIVEEGTHEELLKKRGYYWKMFELQKQYYQENCEPVFS
ncbi:MAG: ABC transporter ATP-binding protein [Acutalibacteraceae bacterium]|jgi:ATP-binding cassette subfamily B protein